MGKYDDMIHLSPPESKRHKRMPRENRAAQFAPFAALTGHGDAIAETARITDEKIELEEDMYRYLDEVQQKLNERMQRGEHPEVTITYFLPDDKKAGGSYRTCIGLLKRMDVYTKEMVFVTGERIAMDMILEIEY